MGDPLSPGLTIITCAWMEDKWMAQQPAERKRFFRAKRYMDDILCLFAKDTHGTLHRQWNAPQFIRDMERSEIYWPPLKLEPGKESEFLETHFEVRGTGITFRLKNSNETGLNIWRYHHYDSYCHPNYKKANLLNCLKKVHATASDIYQLKHSACAKLNEFRALGYPTSLRRYACAILGRDTGDTYWFRIRDWTTR